MSQEIPVDYDDRTDPDCPKTAGCAVINAIGFTGCIRVESKKILAWNANAAEQIEARLAEMGWELQRTRPWKK